MKSKSLFCILLISLLSCKRNNNNFITASNCDSDIDSITVLYFNHTFNRVKALKCEELNEKLIPDFQHSHTGVLDAKIMDCSVLKEIGKEIQSLTPDTLQTLPDIRIAANIYYNDGSIKRICMAYSLNDIFVDGVKQVTNNRLIFLIKNNIGYYSWFENAGEYMDELKDTSFVKAPIIISPYYKQYKEMQEKNIDNCL